MKPSKIIIFSAIIFLLSNSIGQAQYVHNAIKFSQNHYEGSARSVAMGNAFTGLGGEIGAININPASGGLYKYGELLITPSLGSSISNSNYLNNNSSESRTRVGFSNAGFIIPINTGRSYGLINFNIGINASRTNDYNTQSYSSGINNESSWLGPEAIYAGGINSSNLGITDDYNPFKQSSESWRTILLWNSSLLDNLSSNTDYVGATENLDDLTNQIYLGGPINQEFNKLTYGSKTQYDINFSGNISNKLFFGVNIGVQSIFYNHLETYSETAENPRDFQTGFNSFTHEYRESTRGTGFNLNFGVIYKPVDGLSLGVAISTPTWLYLNETYEESIYSKLDATEAQGAYSANISTPLGIYDYRINTPFKWSVGAAYVFNKRMVVSFDYESMDYGSTKLLESYNDNGNRFRDENNEIRDNFSSVNNFRAGMEIRVNKSISIRGGYNYYDYLDKGKSFADMHIASVGFGINSESGFFADLAYQQTIPTKESFTLYDNILDENNNLLVAAPVGTLESWRFKIFLSLGFRF